MGNLREVAASVERRSRRKLARGTVTLALPIYDGQYLARFGVLDSERIAQFERLRDPDADSSEAAAEFVADACRCILARPEGGVVPVKLTHDDDRPVRFDREFAEAVGLEPAPGCSGFDGFHDVVLACWTVEGDDGERTVSVIALDRFAAGLLDWMADTSRLVEGELVGESNGSRP